MSRVIVSTLLVAALFLTPALAQPAEAQVVGGLSVGGWFSIGGVHFSLAFGAPIYGGRPGYYYRTPASFGVPGVYCTDRCFRQGGYVYHDPDCPVVQSYFGRYGVEPDVLFQGYAPPPIWGGAYYGGYSGGYSGRYYGNRYDRYPRYQRYDRRERYERSQVTAATSATTAATTGTAPGRGTTGGGITNVTEPRAATTTAAGAAVTKSVPTDEIGAIHVPAATATAAGTAGATTRSRR